MIGIVELAGVSPVYVESCRAICYSILVRQQLDFIQTGDAHSVVQCLINAVDTYSDKDVKPIFQNRSQHLYLKKIGCLFIACYKTIASTQIA